MLKRKNRVQIAVGTAVAGGMLAAATIGAFAATGGANPRALACGSGYGYDAGTGYGYAPACTPLSFHLGTNVIAAGQHTKVLVSGPAGDAVQILVKGAASSTFTVIANQTINSLGATSLFISPSTNSTYFVRDSKVATPRRFLLVKAVQSLVVRRNGHMGIFTGHIAPSLRGRVVTVYYYVRHGHVTVACRTKVVGGGQYSCSHTFTGGTYYIFAQTDSDKYNAAGRSSLHTNVI